MSIWILLVFGAALLISFAYVSIIVLFTIGWFRLRENEMLSSSHKASVSVIIAARNEESKIGICLRAVTKQDYSPGLFEVIVVDDHSADNTIGEINRIIAESPGIQIKLLQLTGDEQGKKAAITKAISVANNEWIVTTDADCVMEKDWLGSLMAGSVDHKIQLLLAPVIFQKTTTIFGQLQELEFLSLIASSAGTASVGLPIMCNGANLAYRREAYNKVFGFVSDSGFASGDDMFLMMKIRNMYGSGAIRFAKSNSASVITNAESTLSEFLNQRLRWVSKSKGYKDPWVILTSVIIFAQSFLMLIAILAWTTGLIGSIFPLLFFTAKFLADFPIMMAICRFTKRSWLLIWYLPLQIIYPVYIVGIGLLGNMLSFTWKGRRLK
jgi:cellulose synthase/poly-beta-1,6-N-acetylglucosamine synthase-like glycosyltransferase